MNCAWKDEPCDRTDIEARGLCKKHYDYVKSNRLFDEYPRPSERPEYLHCVCEHPDLVTVSFLGAGVTECATCHKPWAPFDRSQLVS